MRYGRYDGCHVQLSIYNLKTSNFSWTPVAGGCLAAIWTQWKLLHLRNINLVLTDNWHCQCWLLCWSSQETFPAALISSLHRLYRGYGGEASGGWMQLGMWWVAGGGDGGGGRQLSSHDLCDTVGPSALHCRTFGGYRLTFDTLSTST